MTKTDIAERILTRTGLSKKESTDLMETFISLIKSTLESGENLKISGFGNFEVKKKPARRGRNPQTGEAIILEARRVLTFKPSVLLRKTINGEQI